MIRHVIGKGKLSVGVVTCLHGNETIGKQAMDMVDAAELPEGIRIVYVVANTQAMKMGTRFVSSDCNRSFPGSLNGNTEERLALKILKSLKGCRYVIDVHSTYATQPDTIIVTKPKAMEVAHSIPIKHVLLMGKSMAHGGSLIDNVERGVSLEFSRSRKPEHVKKVLLKSLSCMLGSPLRMQKELYSVEKVDGDAPPGIRNFRAIRGRSAKIFAGGMAGRAKTAYPIFVGEKAYRGFHLVAVKAPTASLSMPDVKTRASKSRLSLR